jgi:hypothetical protein
MTYWVDFEKGKDTAKGTSAKRPLATIWKALSKVNVSCIVVLAGSSKGKA